MAKTKTNVDYVCSGCKQEKVKGATEPYTCEECLKKGKPDASKTGGNGKKKECPLTHEEFNQKAEPVQVRIGNQDFLVDPKEFSTGSFGWYLNGKTTLEIGGVRVPVQIGLNLTVVGSKEAK